MEYGRDRYIRDASQIYSECKDLNEYLQQQRAEKQAEAIRMKVETASRQKGKEATGEEPAKRGSGLSMKGRTRGLFHAEKVVAH